MRVRVYGECNVLPEEDVRYSLDWLGYRLMGDASGTIALSVHFKSEGMGLDLAHVMPTNLAIQTRHFTMDVSTKRVKTVKMLYTCFAHEMVHVWQYATRALEDVGATGELARWRSYILNTGEFGYYDLPWEVEANHLEKTLYDEFATHLKEKRRKRSKVAPPPPEAEEKRTAEVRPGKVWFNVVMYSRGVIKMCIPAKSQEDADRMVEEWVSVGTVTLSALMPSHAAGI